MDNARQPRTATNQLSRYDWFDELETVELNALFPLPNVADLLTEDPVKCSPATRPVKKVRRDLTAGSLGGSLGAPAKSWNQDVKVSETEEDIWQWADLETPATEQSVQVVPGLSLRAGFAQPVWAEPLSRPPVAWAPPASKPVKPLDDTLTEKECVLVRPPPGTNIADVQLVETGSGVEPLLSSSVDLQSFASTSLGSSSENGEGARVSLLDETKEFSSGCGWPLESISQPLSYFVRYSVPDSCGSVPARREAAVSQSAAFPQSSVETETNGAQCLAVAKSGIACQDQGMLNLGSDRSADKNMGMLSGLPNMRTASESRCPRGSEKRLKDLQELLGRSGQRLAVKTPVVAALDSRPADLSSRLAQAIHEKIRGPSYSQGKAGASLGVHFLPRLPSMERSARRVVTQGTMRVGMLLPDNVELALVNLPVERPRGSGSLWTNDSVLRIRLLGLAEAVAEDDEDRYKLLKDLIHEEATPLGSPSQRAVHFLALGLAKRKEGGMTAAEYLQPSQYNLRIAQAIEDMTNRIPHVMFAMDAINNAIQAAVEGEDSIHIIDLSMWSGQWAPLLRSLSERPGGPPFVRITAAEAPVGTPWGIGPSVPAAMQKTQVLMAAAEAGVRCEFNSVTARLEELTPSLLNLRPGEPLAVAACMCLQQLPDATVVCANPRDTFLKKVWSWNPRVFVVCASEVEQNTPSFFGRLREGLDFFTTLFDSFEAMAGREMMSRQIFEQVIWAKEVFQTAASEGLDRVQRDERVEKWQKRMRSCGYQELPFTPAMLDSLHFNATQCHPGFSVANERGALMLQWKGKGLVHVHAWSC